MVGPRRLEKELTQRRGETSTDARRGGSAADAGRGGTAADARRGGTAADACLGGGRSQRRLGEFPSPLHRGEPDRVRPGSRFAHILRRCGIVLVGMVLAALAGSAGVFALAAVSPANPLAHTVAGWEFASAQAREHLETAYDTGGWFGAWRQWLLTSLGGDLGYSRILHTPVAEVIGSRGLNTIAATGTAVAITAVIVVAVSVLLARFPGLAHNSSASGLVGMWLAVPSFLIALFIVVFWGARLPNPATSAPITLIPPVAITIALAWSAMLIAAARSAAAEAWSSPWARALIGRGFPPSARVSTVLPVVLGAVRSPAIIYLPVVVLGEAAVEAVLSYPGLGNALVEAAAGADLPLLATVTGLAAALTTGLVLIVRSLRGGAGDGRYGPDAANGRRPRT